MTRQNKQQPKERELRTGRAALAFEQQPRERSLRTATRALPFEQQPKESDKAFAAFAVYLGMGPDRSLSLVAKNQGKSQRLMEKWSKRFDWAARVQAHGAHLALVEREAAEALVRAKGVDWVVRQEEHRSDEWQMRCELIETAREALRRWKARPERCGSLEGIARLLELASKLGRLSSGMATDKTEVKAEVDGVVRIEIEAALDKIYGRPLAGEVVDVEEVQRAEAGDQKSGRAGSGAGSEGQRLLTSSSTGGSVRKAIT